MQGPLGATECTVRVVVRRVLVPPPPVPVLAPVPVGAPPFTCNISIAVRSTIAILFNFSLALLCCAFLVFMFLVFSCLFKILQIYRLYLFDIFFKVNCREAGTNPYLTGIKPLFEAIKKRYSGCKPGCGREQNQYPADQKGLSPLCSAWQDIFFSQAVARLYLFGQQCNPDHRRLQCRYLRQAGRLQLHPKQRQDRLQGPYPQAHRKTRL